MQLLLHQGAYVRVYAHIPHEDNPFYLLTNHLGQVPLLYGCVLMEPVKCDY